MIAMRADTKDGLPSIPPVDVAAIARLVPKSDELTRVERNVSALRKRREEKRSELVTMIAERRSSDREGRPTEHAILTADREYNAIDMELRNAQSELKSLRTARSQRVAAALDESRRSASEKAIAGITLIREAVLEISQIAEAITMAGGEAVEIAPPDVRFLELCALRWAGLK